MRIHVLSLPHTETTKTYNWCAFTQKVRKFASMMTDTGYDVRLYAGEENEARVTEHVPVIDRAWQERHFGSYDWATTVFNEFDPDSAHWREYNERCIAAIRERMEPGDILAMSMGWSQKTVAEALPSLYAVENGIGYAGVWAPYRVYESHAWEHYLAARRQSDDARFFDAVIPNSFEEDEFPAGTGNGGYALFVGRFIRRKGIQIAVEATKAMGIPLVMAGQGVLRHEGNRFTGIDIEVEGSHLSHVGVVGSEERAKLMGKASFVFAPSIYLEPFCGVHVEAMMTGTPVLTTDWGVFTETVIDGFNGYRCRSLKDFVDGGLHAASLDRFAIRNHALKTWSTDVVRHQYDTYFKKLSTLSGKGWYEL